MFNFQMLRQKAKVKDQSNIKCSDKKAITNRQRRNVSQIANVHRKVRQTDRSPCKHTVKYRQSSPCKCNAIDNARPSDSAMVNATPMFLAYYAIGKLETFSQSNFTFSTFKGYEPPRI